MKHAAAFQCCLLSFLLGILAMFTIDNHFMEIYRQSLKVAIFRSLPAGCLGDGSPTESECNVGLQRAIGDLADCRIKEGLK